MAYLCIKLIFKEFLIFKILKRLIYKFFFLFYFQLMLCMFYIILLNPYIFEKSHNLI